MRHNILSLFAIFFFGLSAPGAEPVAPVEFQVEQNLGGFEKKIRFTVPPQHHFNKDSPSEAEGRDASGEWMKAAPIEIDGRTATAAFSTAIDVCTARARLFVCDDANTYCLPQGKQFRCEAGKWAFSAWDGTAVSGKGNVKDEAEGLFIVNDPDRALAEAKKSGKPLLIDFFGVWCPPCNYMDEAVFSSKRFKPLARRFVLLKLDADKPVSWPLKAKYKVGGYPTMVFAAPDGDEIQRVVGSRTREEFSRVMQEASKSKSQKALKAAADKGDSAASYRLAEIYLERREYQDAYLYFLKSGFAAENGDEKRAPKWAALLGLYGQDTSAEGKARQYQILVAALKAAPRSIQTLEWADQLISYLEDRKDEAALKPARKEFIEKAKWHVNNPSPGLRAGWMRVDSIATLASALEGDGQKEEAKKQWKIAVQEYERQIKVLGMDPQTARGLNLERLYCMWKAGDFDKAEAGYKHFEGKYPGEFTFFYQHAHMLKAQKKNQEAIDAARVALQQSYGDNRIRVAQLLGDLLVESGAKDEAKKIADKVLAETQLPEDKTIRTHRYYDKLKNFRSKL